MPVTIPEEVQQQSAAGILSAPSSQGEKQATPVDAVTAIRAGADALNVALLGWEAEPEDRLRLLQALRRTTVMLAQIDSLLVRDLYLTAEHGKRVVDGIGEVWVTRTRAGEEWEGPQVVRDYVETKIRANDGEAPDPDVVVEWVLEVLSASKPRVTPIRDAGLDPNDYRVSIPGKPQVTVPLD